MTTPASADAAPIITKQRTFQYGTRRVASSGSGSKASKSNMFCLERAAVDMRKSPAAFWRLLAIVSTFLFLFSLATRDDSWGSPLTRVVDAAQVPLQPAAAPPTTTISEKDSPPTLPMGSRVAQSTEEADEDINITRRKKVKRQAELANDQFCKQLRANPVPNDRSCRRVGNNATCTNGEVRMFSQFSQDFYLYKHHFKHLKRTGTYMDVASNDAVGISNSYFFDRCLGWRGVCVEGNPRYFERLFRLRTCTLVPTCVSGFDGSTVEFGLMGGAGGIMDKTNKHMKVWAAERKQITTLKERCTTMKKLAEREEMWEIDYLSLDVEGHELEVLKGIDWERMKINVITIEVNRESAPAIEKAMLELHYKRHHAKLNPRNDILGSDVVYLHNDVEWGAPQ